MNAAPGEVFQATGAGIAAERRAGAALHISSLPGPHGIGDVGDSAHRFVDRLVDMGLSVWQFLPLGPTAFGNSPYQPLSAFAGNPLLIGLEPLQRLGLLSEDETAALHDLPRAFTDYARVLPLKDALLSVAADRFLAPGRQRLRAGFEQFCHGQGAAWLDDFALFRVLKRRHGERAWSDWDRSFAQRDAAALRRLSAEQAADLERVKVLQYFFDQQWSQLQAYARERGVLMFGDMPIYLALDSADAWARAEMLQLDDRGLPLKLAGVPPDYFSADGQLWGNPLYDWDWHESDGYRWWIGRVRHASRRVDLLRIDHFRGFESYWAVPQGASTARDGHWETGPGDPIFEAMRGELGELRIVAENLGIITEEVEDLRRRHGIPGMLVLQFALAELDFDPADIEKNCVCYTGTHDNDTTAGWFAGGRDDTRTPEEVSRTQARVLALTGGSARTIHSDLVRMAFDSGAGIAVAPLQDYLGLGSEARFNLPGTSGGNWRWRLQENQLPASVTRRIREMAEASCRTMPV